MSADAPLSFSGWAGMKIQSNLIRASAPFE